MIILTFDAMTLKTFSAMPTHMQCWSPQGDVLGLEAPRGQCDKSLALRLKSLASAMT